MRYQMKGRSEFDQPHAFLWRASYTLRGWTFAAVTLLKTGTPFTVVSGSDAPGFGNVDGNGGDRPNLVDPSILGRTPAMTGTTFAPGQHVIVVHCPLRDGRNGGRRQSHPALERDGRHGALLEPGSDRRIRARPGGHGAGLPVHL